MEPSDKFEMTCLNLIRIYKNKTNDHILEQFDHSWRVQCLRDKRTVPDDKLAGEQVVMNFLSERNNTLSEQFKKVCSNITRTYMNKDDDYVREQLDMSWQEFTIRNPRVVPADKLAGQLLIVKFLQSRSHGNDIREFMDKVKVILKSDNSVQIKHRDMSVLKSKCSPELFANSEQLYDFDGIEASLIAKGLW